MAKYKFDWDKLKTDIKEEQDKKSKGFKDDRFWSPDWKAAVKAKKFFVFRFLPDTEGTPFTKYYNHGFKYRKGSESKWYINNCSSTLTWDPACPICAKNSEYWESPYESDKEIAKQRKRRLNYVSNVLVVSDPINPDNEGKVFLYRYGAKIYEKIEKLLFPSEQDLADPDFEQFIPFDLYDGADFKLKIKMQGDFPNYDDSEFSRQKPVAKNDGAVAEIMGQTHLLSEFTDPKNFPEPEKVLEQIGFLLGADAVSEAPAPREEANDEPEEEENPFASNGPVDESEEEESQEESAEEESQEEAIEESSDEGGGDDADADAAWFANLK